MNDVPVNEDDDPIVAEVRRIRQEHAAAFNYDLNQEDAGVGALVTMTT